VFSKATWIIIAVMMGIGILLRITPMPHGLRATVLIAVGIGMFYGAANYLRKWHLVRQSDPHTSTPPVKQQVA
jgi:disulfide bond formation protein DsbB